MKCCHRWVWPQFPKSCRLSHQSTRRHQISQRITLLTLVYNRQLTELGKCFSKSQILLFFHDDLNFRSKGKKPTALSVHTVQVTNIQPKENVVYTKQTQTTNSGTQHERDGEKLLRNLLVICCAFKTSNVLCLKSPLVDSCKIALNR